MKKYLVLAFILVMLFVSADAQKKVSELMLQYDATVNTGSNDPKLGDAFDGSTATVYIKGNLSRSEMVNALASFTTIHDSRTGGAVVLQEVSGQKLLIRMTADDWKDKNKKYDGIIFVDESETKMIAGYKCNKASASLKNGGKLVVYYTTEIVPENSDYDYQFKNLKGLPLEYELTQGSVRIKYAVAKISLNPVPASKFDIPKSGYRELTYQESRKLGGGNQ